MFGNIFIYTMYYTVVQTRGPEQVFRSPCPRDDTAASPPDTTRKTASLILVKPSRSTKGYVSRLNDKTRSVCVHIR
jgi:hypothetical protein